MPRTTVKVVRGFFIHGAAPGGPTSGGLLGARAHGWSRPAVAAGAPGGRGRPSAGGAVATRCGNGLASIARFMRRSARISEVGLEAEGAHSPVCQHENPSLWAIVSAPGVPEVEMLRKLVAAVAALTCLLVLPIASARAQGDDAPSSTVAAQGGGGGAAATGASESPSSASGGSGPDATSAPADESSSTPEASPSAARQPTSTAHANQSRQANLRRLRGSARPRRARPARPVCRTPPAMRHPRRPARCAT